MGEISLVSKEPKNSGREAEPEQHSQTVKGQSLEDRELDENSRLLLVLKHSEGLPIKEIGRIMNLPEGTVKARLHRTRSRAAEILKDLREL